ncbi:unnamed protein product [Prunus armeniaca]|uniref:Endonuclease/exonuclease/phosphatase domain-containing protein n=1 Tax=Prunus armeniaca TaxID=36596 RepID=A0A6J5XCB0_PRUAR|nr:unnamed protein product [Prunus armeniaca]
MDAFEDVVNNCALCEVNYIRPHFTWWNGREGNVMVEERLDRALVTDDVLEFFPQAKVVHLISDSSGHHPISLELGLNESKFSCTRKGRRRVHFEEFWVEESSCSDVIIDAWNSRNLEEVSLLHKIELCGQRLDCWNKNRFGNIPRRLKQVEKFEKPQDPSRIPRNSGRVLSVVVRNVNGELMGAIAKPVISCLSPLSNGNRYQIHKDDY